jgi:hypothetical protein
VDSAFKTALKRSRIPVNGHLSPHDLHDVFRTEATIQGVDYDAREFAIGHTVDPRGYDKCYSDLTWLWKELSKIYQTNTQPRKPADLWTAMKEAARTDPAGLQEFIDFIEHTKALNLSSR